MNAEITDKTAKPAPTIQGWVFIDASCPLCTAAVRRWGAVWERRGFQFVALQADWARARLGPRPGELPAEMKLLLADGRLLGGWDAVIHLGRAVWWLWPVATAAGLPGINALGWRAYRWLAANRHCLGGACAWSSAKPRRPHHAATTFLELP